MGMAPDLSPAGDNDGSAGDSKGTMKSSRFMGSDVSSVGAVVVVVADVLGAVEVRVEWRSWAMPLPVLDGGQNGCVQGRSAKRETGTYEWRRSRSLRLRLIAIIRQVRFSMRSWLGSWAFVLEYNLQI